MERQPESSSEKEGAEEKNEKVDLGRRRALDALFGLGFTALTAGHPVKELFEETALAESTERELANYLDRLKSEFGVEVDFTEVSGNDAEVSSRELSLAEKKDIAANIYAAVALYPREYIERVGLKRIRGVKWMDIPRLEWYQRLLVRGYVDRAHKETVHLNKETLIPFGDFFGWTNSDRMRYATHHELYHVADEHIGDEEFNAKWTLDAHEHGVEPPGQGKYFGLRGKGYPSAYASSAPHEDRAEVAAMLLTSYARTLRWCKEDPALLDKVSKIKEEFRARSGGFIDDTYWDLLRSGDTKAIQQYFNVRRAVRATRMNPE